LQILPYIVPTKKIIIDSHEGFSYTYPIKKRVQFIWTQWILLEDERAKYGLEKGIPPDAL
jgi:hypothetical protein